MVAVLRCSPSLLACLPLERVGQSLQRKSPSSALTPALRRLLRMEQGRMPCCGGGAVTILPSGAFWLALSCFPTFCRILLLGDPPWLRLLLCLTLLFCTISFGSMVRGIAFSFPLKAMSLSQTPPSGWGWTLF